MDISALSSHERSVRANIRNFLLTATPRELAAELALSRRMSDTFRARCILEIIEEQGEATPVRGRFEFSDDLGKSWDPIDEEEMRRDLSRRYKFVDTIVSEMKYEGRVQSTRTFMYRFAAEAAPLALATIRITFTPPAGWDDAKYDAALARIDEALLARLANFAHRNMRQHDETREVSVTTSFVET